jgi:F0F1-type ATP synthase assembly protein I
MSHEKDKSALAVGLQLIAFIATGVVIGQFIEHSVPRGKGLITLLCIILAFVAFVVQLLKAVKK